MLFSMSLLICPCWCLQVRLVTDKTANKPRGYAFIEYVHTRDMKGTFCSYFHGYHGVKFTSF